MKELDSAGRGPNAIVLSVAGYAGYHLNKPQGGNHHAYEAPLAILVLASAMIVASWSAAQVVNAAEPFVLTSSAFKDGTLMPKKHANNTQGNAELHR